MGAGLTNVPPWALKVLESPYTAPVAGDSSLTDYFSVMSNGDNILTGETYSEVVLLPHDIPWYIANGGVDAANQAVITAVDVNLDFSSFDIYNNATGQPGSDEIVDFVFVLYRTLYDGNSAAFLDASGGTAPLGYWTLPVDEGELTVDATSGARANPALAIRGFWSTVEILAHEYGHHLVSGSVINDHTWSMGQYCLMEGNTGFKTGPNRMSTYLRHKLGWISPAVTLDLSVGGQQEVVLDDILTNPTSGYAIVKTQDPRQYFILECVDSTSTYYSSVDDCLSAPDNSGLMVYHVAEIPISPGGVLNDVRWKADFNSCAGRAQFPPRVDPEIAAAMWDPVSGAPDPKFGWDILSANEDIYSNVSSHRDQFRRGIGSVNLMTPYTNPSTNLYWYDASDAVYYAASNCSKRQEQSIPTGLSFYNIHWVRSPGGGNGQISVTVRRDGAPSSTDGYILPAGMALDGEVRLMADVKVASGNALTIASGARISSKALGDLGGTGGDPAQVEVTIDGTVQCNGTAQNPILVTASRDNDILHWIGPTIVAGEAQDPAPGNWFGFKLGASGTLSGSNTMVRYATGALNFATNLFPDLSGFGSSGPITYADNLLDITFDRDVRVLTGTTRSVPNGAKVGFAPTDAGDVGVDPARVEVIVEGTGLLQLQGSPNPIILQSTKATPAAGDWYGIRIPGTSPPSLSVLNTTIRHAASAIHWENANWPDFSNLGTGWTFESVLTRVAFDRDHTISTGQTITIPAGWSIGFAANRDVSSGGVDVGRIEVICDGSFILAGTSTQPVTLRSTKSGDLGSWYGIRLTDYAKILTTTQFGVIQEAGGALSVEGAAATAGIPHFTTFAGKLTFTGNRSDICFDRDVTIPTGQTVTIPAGWRIGFRSGTEAVTNGVSTMCELIVDGSLIAGTMGGARVAFTSNANQTNLPNVNWYGVRYREPYYQQYLSSYGYVPNTSSKFETAEIAGAKYGVCIETLCGPVLRDINFVGTGNDPTPINILLNGTDVVIPYGKKWTLNPGTQVVAENASTTDYFVDDWALGETGLVDLIVQGILETLGQVPSSRVKFGPRTIHDATAKDWGGIYFDAIAGRSLVDGARISHARIPMTMIYQKDSTTVSNTEFRNFAETAIWVSQAYDKGIVLKGNHILRGASSPLLGNNGIVLEKCSRATVVSDTVSLIGQFDNLFSPGGNGIHVFNTKAWYLSQGSPSIPDSTTISRNVLTGKVTNVPSLYNGLLLEWACGPGVRATYVADNVVQKWSENCIAMWQCSDVQVSRNDVTTANERQLFFERNDVVVPNCDPVTFACNQLELSSNPARASILTDQVAHLKFGPRVAGVTGDNTFKAPDNSTNRKYVEEILLSTGTLDLRGNAWKTGSAFLATEADIRARLINQGVAFLDVAGFLTSSPVACVGMGSIRPPGEVVASDPQDATTSGVEKVLGIEEMGGISTRIVAPRPNPSRDALVIEFVVDERSAGASDVSVYDVAGRLVSRITRGEFSPGLYRTSWKGTDEAGRKVSAGVYFLRLETRKKSMTVKIVRVR